MSETPLSWRDVNKAVEDSRVEVLRAITDLKSDLVKVSDDHEERIRFLEKMEDRSSGQAKGIRQLLSVERAGIATLIALCSAGLALASFFGG